MKYIAFTLFAVLMFSCTRQSQNYIATSAGNCENGITISAYQFSKTSPDDFRITKAAIKGDCLEIAITASGCDGGSWKATLVTNGAVAESFPPQMFLKILFKNTEDCDAVHTRTFSYNLKPLRVKETNKLTLNLQGHSGALLYEY